MSTSFKPASIALIIMAFLSGCSGNSEENAEMRNGYARQKVVYHLDDVHSGNDALRNAFNQLNIVGEDNIDLIVVSHGTGGLVMVDGAAGTIDPETGKPYNFSGMIESLSDRGVTFYLSRHTINRLGIDESKIDEHVEIIPSGVAHLAHLQELGYLYVKP